MATVLGTTLAGCEPPPLRATQVHEALTRDNRDLALRNPREVAARFARMAENPFSFFRGAVGLWTRDLTTPGAPGALPTDFGEGVAAGILLIGDPHPENFGTFRIPSGIVAGWNDFDVARFGPAVIDVRRLALGFGVFASAFEANEAFADEVVAALARGYIEGMHGTPAQCVDTDDSPTDQAACGPVVERLFQRARSEGGARSEHALLTHDPTQSGRALKVSPSLPQDLEAEVLVSISSEERSQIEEALRHEDLTPRDVARVVGRGVGSRPLLRWIALLADGELIQVKEARDAFVLPGYTGSHDRFFHDNAERVVFARKLFVGFDGADSKLRSVALKPLGAFTTSETGYAQNIRLARARSDVADGALSLEDIIDFAQRAGRALASAHRRSVDVDGDPVYRTLPEALGLDSAERQTAFIDELLEVTQDALPTAQTDHEVLQDVLSLHGPLLGLDMLGSS